MYLQIVFNRGRSCEHDAARECTACFRAAIAAHDPRVWDDFVKSGWIRRGAEDRVESLTTFDYEAEFAAPNAVPEVCR